MFQVTCHRAFVYGRSFASCDLLFSVQALPRKIFRDSNCWVEQWNSASQQWLRAEVWFVFVYWWWGRTQHWQLKENVVELKSEIQLLKWFLNALRGDRSRYPSPPTPETCFACQSLRFSGPEATRCFRRNLPSYKGLFPFRKVQNIQGEQPALF